MNGNFENCRSAYPIGYLLQSEGKYRVTDMRSLNKLDAPAVDIGTAVAVAHTLNERLRNGRYTPCQGHDTSAPSLSSDCLQLIAAATQDS